MRPPGAGDRYRKTLLSSTKVLNFTVQKYLNLPQHAYSKLSAGAACRRELEATPVQKYLHLPQHAYSKLGAGAARRRELEASAARAVARKLAGQVGERVQRAAQVCGAQ